MSDAPVATDTSVVEEPASGNPLSDEVLARYAQRMRPLRILYAVVITVAAVVIAGAVVIAYRRGEISHVTLKTVAAGPPSVALQSPSATLNVAWTSSDTTAIGTPYLDGTVITHDTHTVRGRNARTGTPTWSYTRTDRTVCTAIQVDGVTIAVYKLHGNCDELTALDSTTGQRRWTRTLDKDGAEFNGPATYQVQAGNVMFVSATSIYSIAPSGDTDDGNGGLDHWVFHHVGCTIHGAVLGDAGALISQTCRHQDCSNSTAKYCGDGDQLLLRSALTGTDDNSKTKNPDQITWNKFGVRLTPTVAGHQVGARDAAGRSLQLFDAKTGKAGGTLPLTGSGSTAAAEVSSARDTDLIWIAGRAYALPASQRNFLWSTPSTSVPVVIDSDAGATPVLRDTRLAVATTSGLAVLDPTTGAVDKTYSVTAPAAGSLVFPFGTGFVVAGSSTAVYQ